MKNQRTQKDLLGRWYQLNNLRYLKLIKRIKKNEGFSSIPYKDQLDFLTIGYGHLILPNERHLIEKKSTKIKLEKIFIQDFKKTIKDYKIYLKKHTFNKKDEELLIEMVFQIGIKGVLKFRSLLSNLKKKTNTLFVLK